MGECSTMGTQKHCSGTEDARFTHPAPDEASCRLACSAQLLEGCCYFFDGPNKSCKFYPSGGILGNRGSLRKASVCAKNTALPLGLNIRVAKTNERPSHQLMLKTPVPGITSSTASPTVSTTESRTRSFRGVPVSKGF